VSTRNTIFPTHQCFDDVLEHQVLLDTTDPQKAARQWIVHGLLLFPVGDDHAGEVFAHAWVEDDATEEVWQSGLLGDGRKVWFAIARPLFVARMRVQSMTRYTLAQAKRLNWQHEHFGPWVPAYRIFCRNAGRRGP
jgi:hypothetical protein